MGRVIGKGGATINNIRNESGARIDAEDRDEDHCEFTIRGTEEQVQRAKAMLLERADRAGHHGGAAAVAVGDRIEDGEACETMEFPIAVMGGLIGSRGAKINEVRQTSGAKVQVDKFDERCKVLIAGSDEQIARAKSMIQGLADEAAANAEKTAAVGTGEEDEHIEFPLSAAGRIIGSRGAQISEVRLRSGAQIKVEKLEDCCRVYLSGTSEQVDRAKQMVKALAEDNQLLGGRRAEAEETVEIPQTMVGRVIGRGGETIQRLQRDSGAKIDVNSQQDPCPIRLSGTRDAVYRAQYMIREVIDGKQQMAPAWGVPGYPGYADAWSWWTQGRGYAAGPSSWEIPAGDGGRGQRVEEEDKKSSSEDEEIDLDEL